MSFYSPDPNAALRHEIGLSTLAEIRRSDIMAKKSTKKDSKAAVKAQVRKDKKVAKLQAKIEKITKKANAKIDKIQKAIAKLK